MRSPLAPLLILSAAALSPALGCTNAPANEEGGELRFDPTAPAFPLGDACTDETGDAGGGHAWSDLYRDYFGPTGAASCAGAVGQCHGESSGLGAAASLYVCAGGVQGCYKGITNSTTDLVTVGDTTSDPTKTTLYLTLRKQCGGGAMPKQPATFAFSAADMKRITDWIAAGSPDD